MVNNHVDNAGKQTQDYSRLFKATSDVNYPPFQFIHAMDFYLYRQDIVWQSRSRSRLELSTINSVHHFAAMLRISRTVIQLFCWNLAFYKVVKRHRSNLGDVKISHVYLQKIDGRSNQSERIIKIKPRLATLCQKQKRQRIFLLTMYFKFHCVIQIMPMAYLDIGSRFSFYIHVHENTTKTRFSIDSIVILLTLLFTNWFVCYLNYPIHPVKLMLCII